METRQKGVMDTMRVKRIIDTLLFMIAATACAISILYLSGDIGLVSGIGSGGIALIFLILALKKGPIAEDGEEIMPPSKVLDVGITEIVLLNEEDEVIAEWNLYGKTSMVIGRDVGENQVNVNLNNAAFSSMVDLEHAVLNYSAGNWYVEDLGSKNGISIVKVDGKKYHLTSSKPCLLGMGDILYVAMTKLLLR